MKRWEYDLSLTPDDVTWSQLQDWLDDRGAQGWELVGFQYGAAIWKREKADD